MRHRSRASLGSAELPRTPGLGTHASMAELVQDRALPGRPGVILTDEVGHHTRLYAYLFSLSQSTGVEFALARQDGALVVFSGAPNAVGVPRRAELPGSIRLRTRPEIA